QVTLVVNVASQCGYTDLNYRELVELQDEFSREGFTVLAFPCNQFGEQEPGSMAEITEFTRSYGINFPLFSKVDVSGRDASAVYSFLHESTRTLPQWNFGKYLVGQKWGREAILFGEGRFFRHSPGRQILAGQTTHGTITRQPL
ncbi:Probable glutathione peroxidase 8-B, partial [Geodia barretti]